MKVQAHTRCVNSKTDYSTAGKSIKEINNNNGFAIESKKYAILDGSFLYAERFLRKSARLGVSRPCEPRSMIHMEYAELTETKNKDDSNIPRRRRDYTDGLDKIGQ